MAMVRLEIDYRKEIRFPAELRLGVRLRKLGKSSLALACAISTRCLRLDLVLHRCQIRPENPRSKPFTDEERSLMQSISKGRVPPMDQSSPAPTATPRTIRRLDYAPPDFRIVHLGLDFDLEPKRDPGQDQAEIERPAPEHTAGPGGRRLELVSVALMPHAHSRRL